LAARADVLEVVLEGHALGVRLGGLLEPRVGAQAHLAVGGRFAIDQAHGGSPDQREVGGGGLECGVRAGTATLDARLGALAADARVGAGAAVACMKAAGPGAPGGAVGAAGRAERR